MFRNYLKIAFRNLAKRKVFTSINILGLAIGITCAALILLWIEDEINFDKVFPKQDQIYYVPTNQTFDGEVYTFYSTPGPLAQDLKDEIPEITKSATTSRGEILLKEGDQGINRAGRFVGSDFLDIFSLHFLAGNVQGFLNRPDAIILSQKTAQALFGENTNALNRVLQVNGKHSFTVTGVIEDLPQNVTFGFEWLLPIESYGFGEEDLSWARVYGNNFADTFVELSPNANFTEVDKKVRAMIPSKMKDSENTSKTYAFLHSIKDWHLHSNFSDGKKVGGQITFVRLMLLIAFIILLIACINFMNLSTAQSEKRGKEVGVRKVLGSDKRKLIAQFIVEAIMIASLASVVSVFTLVIVLPFFNTLVEKQLELKLFSPGHLFSLAGITLMCGLLAGWYPSLYLSSFRPVQILKGLQRKKGGTAIIRKGLVIMQFTASIIFIISTIIVYKQVQHAKERDLGYDKENLINIPVTGDIIKNFAPIEQDMISSGTVENVSLINSGVLSSGDNGSGLTWQGGMDTKDILVRFRYISPSFFETVGIELLEGHGFKENMAADSTNTIITQSFARLMGEESAIGKTIQGYETTYNVVGVVNDFRYGNLYSNGSTGPVMFFNKPEWARQMYIKTKSGIAMTETLQSIEEVLKKYNPVFPFEYRFENDLFNARFKNEELIGSLSKIFSVLAICIACLGLFGLAAFTAEQRKKEIGVRKVLGANVLGIVQLLSKDFMKLVLVALVIAFPLAYYIMSNWLRDFAYRIDISWIVFVMAGTISVFIALLTVSFQAIKSATANPVKSLRTE
ncbi:ABC transporter permease [Flagellimonas algicola]|uniref:FtsX-like permease family protein n=1 Tax=Flagellimonas algicola TaxID=2583815 RepID=A0ABY2WKP7_9FLAO|nr:ABC transporter permease [Allomuricauda algicola]TMU55202.1 FtsX-like permease family protein [Allomuricauda algicola]